MVRAIVQLQLLDVVAIKEDLPDHNLLAGQVGTIVEFLAPEVYKVEFSSLLSLSVFSASSVVK
jgi:hypothetical protein